MVLCETIWVLKAAYKLSKTELADILEQLLRTDLFEFENRRLLWDALAQFRQGRADFSDYLICQVNQNSGCMETVSFDQKLSDGDRLKLL